MNFESLKPLLLIIVQTIGVVLLLEAIVIYFFKLRKFWPAIGISLLINLLSVAVLYGGSLLVGKLGYELNGLRIPIQVLLFFWWLSVLADAVLLQLFSPGRDRKTIYYSSLLMNTVSWLSLYFFIVNS